LIHILTSFSTKKLTGKILIKTDDGEGVLYLENGELTHSQYLECEGKEALEYLISITEGKIYFLPHETTLIKTVTGKTSDLLEEFMERGEEWEKIKTIIKSPEDIFKFDLSTKIHAMSFNNEERLILPYLDGTMSVLEISKETNKSFFSTANTVYNIFSCGVIKKVK